MKGVAEEEGEEEGKAVREENISRIIINHRGISLCGFHDVILEKN